MVQVLLRHPESGAVAAFAVDSAEQAYRLASETWGLAAFRITCCGCAIEELPLAGLENQQLEVEYEVLGGKGGFGSLLRIAAAQKKHFNNFDSCRDSNGRRLRDIKNDIRMVEFLKKKKTQQKMIEQEQDGVEKANTERRDNLANIAQAKVDERYTDKLEEWKWRLGKVVKTSYLNKRKPRHTEESTDEKGSEEAGPQKKLKAEDALASEATPSSEPQQPTAIEEEVAAGPAEPAQASRKGDGARLGGVQPPLVLRGPQLPEAVLFEPIELQQLTSIEELESLPVERVTQELKRLGLKCGGTPKDRVLRLWDIKLEPSRVFNPKYLAKNASTTARH